MSDVKVLAFRSRGERYLVRLDAVRAVVRLRGLRRLPGSTGALVGVLDVQETPVAIYDTRTERGGEVSSEVGGDVGGEVGGEVGGDVGGDVMVLAAGWPDNAIGVACDRVDGLVEFASGDESAPETGVRPPGLPHYVETMLRVEGTLLPLVDVIGLAEAQT